MSRFVLIRALLARMVLGCVITAGTHLAGQAPNMVNLHKQAKEGNAEAQYQLANAYLSGNGVPIDLKQGVEWLEKAAKLEHAAAQNALSVMYRKGFPPEIPKDPKQGLVWLRKSAEHGYATAEYNLALLYRDGDGETGISRNPKEAATWFRKAARQPGSGKSQASLEEMLQKKLISKQEANWRAPEPTKEAEKGKAAPFSLAEVETGIKGWITNARMATLVHTYGVDFKLSAATRQRLKDEGADDNLVQIIFTSKRSL